MISPHVRASVLGRAHTAACVALGIAASAYGCSSTTPKVPADPKVPVRVEAEVSQKIATVVIVRWTTSDASIGYVEYGPTRALGLRTPVEAAPTRDHAVALLGLTAETAYDYRAVTADGATHLASAIATVTTGVLPLGLPPLTQTGDGQEQFIVVPILGANVSVTIINGKGQIVWYYTDERQLDFYRARLSNDGKSLLYNAAKISGDPSEASELVRVALDGSQVSSIPIPYLAHDFVEFPDGTLAAMAVEYRDYQGTQLRGNKIVEVAKDGTQQTAWTTWDCFDPATISGDDITQGWGFANALDYDPVQDVYYLSLRNFSSIVRINRQSHACEWVLGLGAPTFTFATGSARFLHEHQFQVRGNHILLMDNDGAGGHTSRVLEYELDLTNKVATQVWSYTATPSVYTFVLGEPLRFDDGSTFINWSAAGQMERLDPTGTSIWKLNTGAGYVFGFHTLVDDLYSGGALPAGLSGT
jgi:hypothetical protein